MWVHHYTPSSVVDEEEAVKIIASRAMQGRPPFAGPVLLRVCFYRSVPASWPKTRKALALEGKILPTSRPDLDNLLKLINDGLQTVVFVDDAQICEKRAWKRYSDTPRVVVEVEEIER